MMERQTVLLNLIERSSTTSDSVYNGPEFEGTKFKPSGAMESTNEACPVTKEDAFFKLLPELEVG